MKSLFRQSPIQCHGLAGNAELFLELYQRTQESLWLERAPNSPGRS
ncbi:MAG TPA: hypothetical protein EYG11_21730 [Candidatus Latescibacteria bacterium]|nr:hypothetical protein [Candidatus Handelsmanbacteria bacterium]HIL11321.1 hypothetical protein [Candidatus Latescibacterota bacterium]